MSHKKIFKKLDIKSILILSNWAAKKGLTDDIKYNTNLISIQKWKTTFKKPLVLSLQKSELTSRLNSQATTIWWLRCLMWFQTQWAKWILDFMLEFVIFLICYWKEYFAVLRWVYIVFFMTCEPQTHKHSMNISRKFKSNKKWWKSNTEAGKNNNIVSMRIKKWIIFLQTIKTSKYICLVGIKYMQLQQKFWWHVMVYCNTVFLAYMFG